MSTVDHPPEASPSHPTRHTGANWDVPYRPSRALAMVTSVLLGVATIILASVVVVDILALRVIRRVMAGVTVMQAEVDAISSRSETISGWWWVMFLATGVLFLLWFYRVYANLPSLGARHLRFGKAWAFWGWIVPILGVWRPKQIINDVWRASDPDLPPTTADWHGGLIPGYWLAWWVSFVVLGSGPGLVPESGSLEAARVAVTVDLMIGGTGILAGLLAIRLVLSTTARQEERANRLHASRVESPQRRYRGT